MEPYFSSMTMDELVFEGRNKAYGAYQLRKINSKYSAISIVVTISVFLILILFSKINYRNPAIINDETTIYIEPSIVELPKTEPSIVQPKTASIPAPKLDIAQKKFVTMVPTPDDLISDNQAITSMAEALDDRYTISDIHQEGNTVVNDYNTNNNSHQSGMGIITSSAINDEEEDGKLYDFIEVSEQPSFPGGNQEMMKFIAKNTNYPEVAIMNGIEGIVTIQFIVNKDGSISDVKIVKDPGGGLGKEAKRVVSSMPKWNPGKQRENPVSVRMMIPIRFKPLR